MIPISSGKQYVNCLIYFVEAKLKLRYEKTFFLFNTRLSCISSVVDYNAWQMLLLFEVINICGVCQIENKRGSGSNHNGF